MAKEISLRVFQQQLAVRLREAQAQTAPNSRLGVESGGRHWLLRLEDIGEVLPVPRISAVPLTRAWFLGIANIRGNLAGAVDFSALMGGQSTPLTADARLVLIANRFQVASGLVVSRLLGLKYIQQMEPESVPGDLPWAGAAYRERETGERVARVWRELDVAALVTHEAFLQAGI